MRRRVARAAAVALLAAAGLASSLYAAGPGARTDTTTSAAATTTVSTATSVLAFTGHGYGHGVGMSQWGAEGYARHGLSYRRILAHYYPGTRIGTATVTTVKVLVAQGKRVALASAGAWTATDAAGTTVDLGPGRLVLTPKLVLPDHPGLVAPLTFSASEPLSVAGRAYRGRLVASSDGKLVSTVDVLGLEAYLRGVVPAEVPSTWDAEALKAQAVAARSYALANLRKGPAFDLYGDTRDQVYGGVDAESDATNAAVEATRRQVLLYRGKVADTLFHASSGGRTVSALEATGTAVPYLVSVADPYDAISPYHDWGPVLLDASKAAKALELGGDLGGLSVVDGASGHVQTLTATTADGRTVTLTGSQVRDALGLRSTWFRPALLSLQPAAKGVTYGGAVSLGGVALGADGVSLEAKAATGTWASAGALTPDAAGSFAAVVKPQVSTSYRLAWGGARVGLARIAVAPKVTAAVAAAGLTGSSRPAVAAAPVELQERDGTAWTTLSSTVADSAGAFTFGGRLAPGTYRVRVAPGHGLAAGLSAPLVVP